VIFRLGLAGSRTQARQIVRHNFVYINSKRVNIPSYLVNKDDIIQIARQEKSQGMIKKNMELTKDRSMPSWLEFDAKELQAKVLKLPEKEDIQQPIQEQLIVELYSK
jgi:small subunit ribosomal protein S4